ncbi:hypothetical protein DSO57_1018295 [Entomophthora muscae]|uniref:Uncharacterized protein n=1 Tax=Entomophthora muscae TaxID=34485 RepID=A0ACC2UE62_9FUNG|nr:hypothetical protein DSO57_1018295 [Entomophthora muscae]
MKSFCLNLSSCAGDDLVYLLRPLELFFLFGFLHRRRFSHLLHLLKDLSRRAQDLVVTGENLVKSLICDDLVLSPPNSDHESPLRQAPL